MKKITIKKFVYAALPLALITMFSACGGFGQAEQVELDLATAPVGGAYYIIGAAIAEVLTDNIPNLTVNSIVAQGSGGNPHMLGRGEVGLAMTNYTSAWNAFHSVGPFHASGRVQLAGIVNLQYSILQFLVLADSGIYSVADLRGRRVNIGPAAGGGAVLFNLLLPFWGLSPADMIVYNISPAEGSEWLRDGRLDVNVPHGALPLPAVSSLANSREIRLLELEENILRQVMQGNPYYDIAYIPPGVYRGINRPVRSVGSQDILVVRQDMDEELAYQITRTIYESMDTLRGSHPSLSGMTFDGFMHSLVRLHPGALRFYRGRGIPLE